MPRYPLECDKTQKNMSRGTEKEGVIGRNSGRSRRKGGLRRYGERKATICDFALVVSGHGVSPSAVIFHGRSQHVFGNREFINVTQLKAHWGDLRLT